jgi:MinD-like ATPase involved in chromosome partitioning or flagellar assembly
VIVTVRSLRGSPGATTAALGLAACLEGGLYVEADCDGGAVAARFGLRREPGVTTLAAEPDATELEQHGQAAPGGLVVVPGPEDPERATLLWERAGDGIAATLARSHAAVVVDIGRGGLRSPSHRALRRVADLELVVLRPSIDELVAAAAVTGSPSGDAVRLVMVGSDRRQLGGALHVWGTVADDPGAARALVAGGNPRRFTRSPLARSLAELADRIAAEHRERRGVPA